jgi:hypothetical protein
MDSAKLKKLQDYSVFLTEQAESKETSGNTSEAIKDYVKLVDVLLLLANEAKDHPTWQQIIGRAEFYQKKVRSMADPNSPAPANNFPPLRKDFTPYAPNQSQVTSSNVVVPTTKEKNNDGSSSVLKSFRSLIGSNSNNKKPDSTNGFISKEPLASPSQMGGIPAVTSMPRESKIPNSLAVASANNSSQIVALQSQMKEEQLQQQKMVPFSIYAQVLHEKSALQDEVKTLQAKEKEYLENLEAKERQLEETLSSMVTKSEYEQVCSRLENSVPREEYEAALLSASIPKERYAELQARVVELEMKLQNSVSVSIIDEVLEYVSFLVSTVVEAEQKIPASGTSIVALSGS